MPIRVGLLFTLLPFGGWAQSVCPSINFLVSRTANLKPTATSHINVVRQADGSYTGFEVTDLAPHEAIAVTPHFERQFAACLPHTLPTTLQTAPSPAPPANVAAISSQLVASELLPSGNYFVASIDGSPYADTLPIQFDLYDPQLHLLSESSVAAPGNSATFVSLALADVNGDGKPDLIALSLGSSPEAGEPLDVGSLWIFLGNGDGAFQPGANYPLPGSFFHTGYSSFAVADLNGDGKPDLAIATGSGVTTIALGKGDGTFSILPANAVTALPTAAIPADPSGAGYIAAADLNGDGKPDLVFGPFRTIDSPSGVMAALGNGDGTFQSPVFLPVRLNASDVGATQIALGDVNGDGIPDIVTAGGTILFGDGKGGFPSRRDYAWNASGSVTLADFDGDGKIDIIVGNGNSLFLSGSPTYPSLTVLFGQGGGAFAGAPIWNAGPGGAVELGQAIAAADFNGDGIPDLVFVDFEGGFLDILKGAGNGDFTQTFQYSFVTAHMPPVSIATADFNRDGKPDVAVLVDIPFALPRQQEVEIFLGNGDGTLQAPMSVPLPAPDATFIAAGDFNGDGIPDLAATAEGGVLIWLGKGDGTFSAPTTYAFSGASLTSLVIGDFNRDGKPDIAVANPGGGSIAILLGKGDGTFATGSAIPVSTSVPATGAVVGPVSLIAADFSGDGALDLAATLGNADGSIGGGIAVLIGNGDGSFQAPSFDAESAAAIAAADINGDKIADLVVADGTLGTVVRISNGDGTFQPAKPIVSTPLFAFAIADFNLDGKLDIAGGVAPTGVAVLLNLSAPPPALAVVSAASFVQGALAPDEIASAFGKDLATAGAPGSTKVSVQDSAGATRPASFYYASPGQVNFVIPASTAVGAASVSVTSGDGTRSATQIQIVPLAPALSTVGSGGIAAAYAIRVSPDNTQTTVPVFAAQGSKVTATPIDLSQPGEVYLLLFGTGFDAASAASTVVNIQGVQAAVEYAGPQLSFAGFDQIGVLLPPSLAGSGLVSVQATLGGQAANRVYIAIR